MVGDGSVVLKGVSLGGSNDYNSWRSTSPNVLRLQLLYIFGACVVAQPQLVAVLLEDDVAVSVANSGMLEAIKLVREGGL